MILIISIKEDYSTNNVIDWIYHNQNNVLRINHEESIKNLEIIFNNDNYKILFEYNKKQYSINDFLSFWFRKGKLNFNSILANISHNFNKEIKKEVFSHLLNEELNTIEQFIIYSLEQAKKLGSYYQGDTNKLKSLAIAQQIGLSIPDSFIFSQKNQLKTLIQKSEDFITKGVQGILSFGTDTIGFNNKTELVNNSDVDEMSNKFFPSFFQNNIKKLYELRIFYLLGEFYSMAIFSQDDEQTKVDFRNYNLKNPNRTVPYKLPKDIERRLVLFMQKMNLDTGSIDMIVTPELEYVFLEVNPVGQYGMTSIPCNYYLDEKIAQYLSDEN